MDTPTLDGVVPLVGLTDSQLCPDVVTEKLKAVLVLVTEIPGWGPGRGPPIWYEKEYDVGETTSCGVGGGGGPVILRVTVEVLGESWEPLTVKVPVCGPVLNPLGFTEMVR